MPSTVWNVFKDVLNAKDKTSEPCMFIYPSIVNAIKCAKQLYPLRTKHWINVVKIC